MTKEREIFKGLSDRQLLQLFEKITSSLDIATRVCRINAMTAEGEQNQEIAIQFWALETMLCGVGAIAEIGTGGGVVGDFHQWMLGPNFRKLGKSAGDGGS